MTCNYLYTTLHQNMIEHLDKVGIDNQVFVPIYDENISVIKPNSNVIVPECFKKRDRVLFQYKSKKIYQSIKDVCNFDDVNLIHAYTLFTDGNIAYKLNAEYGMYFVNIYLNL